MVMCNNVSSKYRSKLMKSIRSKDTLPERMFRKALWARGIRYRKNCRSIYGCPDIAITKHKITVFIDGEFWHGYKWQTKRTLIKSNREYWIRKIERNMEKDKLVGEMLTKEGWLVLRFWSQRVIKNLPECIEEVLKHCK